MDEMGTVSFIQFLQIVMENQKFCSSFFLFSNKETFFDTYICIVPNCNFIIYYLFIYLSFLPDFLVLLSGFNLFPDSICLARSRHIPKTSTTPSGVQTIQSITNISRTTFLSHQLIDYCVLPNQIWVSK